MSNRVRVLLQHPDYGPHMGGKALRIVEQKFDAVQLRRANKFLQPALFTSWPRWKRCLWMARKLGVNWRFQVFREPRGTSARKAAFWQAAEAMGFERPKRHKKNPYKVQFVVRPRQQGRRANMPVDPPRIRNLAELLQDANQFQWAAVDPQQPVLRGNPDANPFADPIPMPFEEGGF